MICIGERVRQAIDHMEQSRYLFALEQVSIGLDMTAKKFFQRNRSSRTTFKELVREYSWLLELMAFPGVNLDNSIFGNFPFRDGKNEYQEPTFQDLMYHVIRCGLIHGGEYNLRFHTDDSIILANNLIMLPERLVWGLLGIVVFCKSNPDERTDDGYYLSIYEKKFTINAWWGREEFIRERFQDRITKNPRITLNIRHDSFHRGQP